MSTRRLVLLRHAKAEHGMDVSDHDRPLTLLGRRQSSRVGAGLAEADLVPDVVLCSTSLRTRQTWELARAALDKARAHLDRPTYITYSDIVFTPGVARAAAASTAEIGLVIDREFRTIYEGRTEHPLDEGEVSDLMPDGTVARVGKRALPPEDAIGEFIGLVRLGAGGATIFARSLAALAHRFEGRDDQPFQRAAHYRNAYLTDLLQELIDSGIQVDPILIEGQWREIDTGQDLDRARMLLESRSKEWI